MTCLSMYRNLSFVVGMSLLATCFGTNEVSANVNVQKSLQGKSDSHHSSHHSSKPKDFKLTCALSRPSATSVATSISDSGRHVYLVYSNEPGFLLAERFENVDGVLISKNVLPVDPNFPVSIGGAASSDFSLFSVVDATITSSTTGIGRVRIFDKNFNLLQVRTIPVSFDNVQALSALGGAFSEDNRYINLSVTDGAIPNSSTSVYILKTSDLSTVVFQTIPANNGGQPCSFLTLEKHGKKKLYLTFMSCQGYVSSDFENTLQPPYYIQMYKVNTDEGSLELIDQSQLPKFAEVDLLPLGDKGLIGHGGFCSLFPNQLSIFDTNSLKTSSLAYDNSEVRELEFDGNKLKVVFKQATNCCSRLLFYPPGKGSTFMLGQNIVTNINGDPTQQTTLQEFYVLAKLGSTRDEIPLKPINLPRQDVKQVQPRFSKDGKWFIRTGQYGYFDGDPTVDDVGVHNVLLFKVIRD